jgi:hypothetical protein
LALRFRRGSFASSSSHLVPPRTRTKQDVCTGVKDNLPAEGKLN